MNEETPPSPHRSVDGEHVAKPPSSTARDSARASTNIHPDSSASPQPRWSSKSIHPAANLAGPRTTANDISAADLSSNSPTGRHVAPSSLQAADSGNPPFGSGRPQSSSATDTLHPLRPPGQKASGPGGPPPRAPAGFVQPSSYLRPRGISRPVPGMSAIAAARQAPLPLQSQQHPDPEPEPQLSPLDISQIEGLREIRSFLKVRTSYDVLPLSFRLIILDTALLVKASLNILIQNGIVSAPLWDSKTSTFAGLLTSADYINVIQYYWQNPDALAQIDQFRLSNIPEIEKAIGVTPVETVSIHPERPLYEACRRILDSRARRIPLVDVDDETQRPMVVSVITQYRILKFIAINATSTGKLKKPLKDINVGTYEDVLSATMDTPVIDVIHMLVKKSISSVPIVDKEGVVLNIFEAVDVITLIKGGVYDDLNLTVGEALLKRSDDFSGICTCSIWDRLDTIFDTIRKSRVHRFVVIDEHGRLKGVLTLSDILEYVLLEGEVEGE